ncbi:MAG: YsnF/AvaK domain-containing protein [Bryobacteraceae bacterium]
MDYKTNQHALVAVFADRAAAETAVQQLKANGFEPDQLEVSSTDAIAQGVASGNAGLSRPGHDTSGGGISGFFERLFGSDSSSDDQEYYSSAARRGQAAVVVHADDSTLDRAADLLNRNGAIEVESRDESGLLRDTDAPRRDNAIGTDSASETIPVVEQELQVGKRAVNRGAVRVYSEMSQQPVTEQIELREEHVKVERRPANRPATEADLAAADRDVVEVMETVEEPVISKRSRVVEEVRVGKEVTSRTETVRDNVLKSQVRVDDSRKGKASGAPTNDFDADFREDFQNRYAADPNLTYGDFAPAYTFGYDMASHPRYKNKDFDEVSEELKTDYMRQNPNSAWERMKGAIRYGWEKVTGNR